MLRLKKVLALVVALLICASSITAVTYAQTLKSDDKGAAVLAMQKQLAKKGYLTNNACDGDFGVLTKRAVQDFQKDNGLSVTGIVDSKTYTKLFGTSSSSGGSVLQYGDNGSDVTQIQQKLVALGYLSSSDATGFYGSKTQAAIKKFQKNKGLTADGICGPTTKSKLLASYSSGGSVTVIKLLKQGDSGAGVVTLQKRLITLGYLSADATGYYGDATKAAVKAFQKARGMKADGICGSSTIAKLFTSSSMPTGTVIEYIKEPGIFQLGDSGTKIISLQKKLASKSYLKADVTGYFGELTYAAVKQYQRAKGLKADGIVGQKTYNSIMGTGSSSNDWRVETNGIKLTESQQKDVYWLARLIYAESGSQPYKGKVAVGSVVMNRVKKYKKSVYDIIFAHSGSDYQFSPAKSGSIYNTPSSSCKQAALEAYLGAKPVGNSLYFINPKCSKGSWVDSHRSLYSIIANHAFYT